MNWGKGDSICVRTYHTFTSSILRPLFFIKEKKKAANADPFKSIHIYTKKYINVNACKLIISRDVIFAEDKMKKDKTQKKNYKSIMFLL